MLRLKHNKKRNIGLLSEFFSKQIAKCVVEKRYSDIDIAKNIWTKYFKEGTELYKESQLFFVLYETNIKNKETAASLLQNIKEHCKKQDIKKLEAEKTALIHEINSSLNFDKDFFNKEVADYKNMATIQILMNHWREQDSKNNNFANNLVSVANLEDKMLDYLISERKTPEINQEVLSVNDKDIDCLVVKIMTEKFNKKYENVLSEEQKNIINSYAFADTSTEQREQLVSTLKEHRMETLSFIEYEINNSNNKNTQKKLSEIKELLEGKFGDFSVLNDDMIIFYTHICKLKEELKAE